MARLRSSSRVVLGTRGDVRRRNCALVPDLHSGENQPAKELTESVEKALYQTKHKAAGRMKISGLT